MSLFLQSLAILLFVLFFGKAHADPLHCSDETGRLMYASIGDAKGLIPNEAPMAEGIWTYDGKVIFQRTRVGLTDTYDVSGTAYAGLHWETWKLLNMGTDGNEFWTKHSVEAFAKNPENPKLDFSGTMICEQTHSVYFEKRVDPEAFDGSNPFGN